MTQHPPHTPPPPHPPRNHLADELRHILDNLHDAEHGAAPKRLVRERLLRQAAAARRATPLCRRCGTRHTGVCPDRKDRP